MGGSVSLRSSLNSAREGQALCVEVQFRVFFFSHFCFFFLKCAPELVREAWKSISDLRPHKPNLTILYVFDINSYQGNFSSSPRCILKRRQGSKMKDQNDSQSKNNVLFFNCMQPPVCTLLKLSEICTQAVCRHLIQVEEWMKVIGN